MREIMRNNEEPQDKLAQTDDEIRRLIDSNYETTIRDLEEEERKINKMPLSQESNKALKEIIKKRKEAKKERMNAYADRGLINRKNVA